MYNFWLCLLSVLCRILIQIIQFAKCVSIKLLLQSLTNYCLFCWQNELLRDCNEKVVFDYPLGIMVKEKILVKVDKKCFSRFFIMNKAIVIARFWGRN